MESSVLLNSEEIERLNREKRCFVLGLYSPSPSLATKPHRSRNVTHTFGCLAFEPEFI